MLKTHSVHSPIDRRRDGRGQGVPRRRLPPRHVAGRHLPGQALLAAARRAAAHPLPQHEADEGRGPRGQARGPQAGARVACVVQPLPREARGLRARRKPGGQHTSRVGGRLRRQPAVARSHPAVKHPGRRWRLGILRQHEWIDEEGTKPLGHRDPSFRIHGIDKGAGEH